MGQGIRPIPGHHHASPARWKRRANLYRCLVQRSSATSTRNQAGERREAVTTVNHRPSRPQQDGQRRCLQLTSGGLIGVRPPHASLADSVMPNVPRAVRSFHRDQALLHGRVRKNTPDEPTEGGILPAARGERVLWRSTRAATPSCSRAPLARTSTSRSPNGR